MTLAIHWLAGAAAALAVGGLIVGGSMFLVSKSMFLVTKTVHRLTDNPSPGNVVYIQSFPLKRDNAGKPVNCGIADGHTADGKSFGATVPCRETQAPK